jgi:hypothetical protein
MIDRGSLSALAALSLLFVPALPASAQTANPVANPAPNAANPAPNAANPAANPAAIRCPAGKTASGTCANPFVVQDMLQRGVILSQAKISYLGFPLVFPSNSYGDASRDRQSLNYGIDAPPPSIPSTTPAPGTFIRLPSNVNPASLNIAAPYSVVPGGIRIR